MKIIVLKFGGTSVGTTDRIKKVAKIIVKYKKRRPGDVGEIYSNIIKLKKILNWRPKHNNIKLIIESAAKWEKKLKSL